MAQQSESKKPRKFRIKAVSAGLNRIAGRFKKKQAGDPSERHAIRQAIKPWHVAMAISLLGILGLHLPWVWADDVNSSYNAVGILMHYPTANDKLYMTRTTPIGSLISVIAPAGIIVGTLALSVNILVRQQVTREAMGAVAGTLAAVFALLWGCKEILDPDMARLGPFNVPEAGLFLVIFSCAGVAAVYFYEAYQDRWNGPRAKNGQPGMS